MTKLLKNQSFTLGLIAAVLLAFIFPQLGAPDGPLRAGLLSKAGIVLIFLLQGLSLPTRELHSGIRDWRLQGFILGWNFIGTALILGLAAIGFQLAGMSSIAAGFAYLALLPTTISSAVALTGSAGGNLPASIFATTISNIIGVFWVPMGCVLLFATGSESALGLVGPLLLNLAKLILLPLALGQLLRPLALASGILKHIQPHFRTASNSIIAFIVFAAFCRSILSEAWLGVSAWSLLLILAVVLNAVLLIHAMVWHSSKWLIGGMSSRIAALFTGSQKTLATGVPMAMAIFADHAIPGNFNLGLMLLPLMCFHPLQLFVGALLVQRLRPMSLSAVNPGLESETKRNP